jgi:hypothetical protein
MNQQEPLQILITGIPKTGSTALFHSIKNALPVNSICLFEPEDAVARFPGQNVEAILVKCFINFAEVYSQFNKKILIVRDPRDQVISQMLYRPFNIVTKKLITPDERMNNVLDKLLYLLREKEKHPGTISVKSLRELLLLDDGNKQQKLIKYNLEHPDHFIFRYEDYIDGNFTLINDYLGLNLGKVASVPQKRVVRSKSYGSWKDWFTREDVKHYRALFGNYMKTFGYDDDWELNPSQTIDPSMSYLYVEKLIDEAKNKSDIK